MAGTMRRQKLLGQQEQRTSTDANSQQLLAQLKNKAGLEKIEATKQAKNAWILGTWEPAFFYRYSRGTH